MKTIRIILAIIVLILAGIVIVGEASNTALVIPYMLISLGVYNIFNGAYLSLMMLVY